MLKRMKRGDFYQLMSGSYESCILLDIIMDTKPVYLLSNCLHPHSRKVVRRNDGEHVWPASIGIDTYIFNYILVYILYTLYIFTILYFIFRYL